MRDLRRVMAVVAVLLVGVLAGCGGGADATDDGGEVDPEAATRASATAYFCELWEQARDTDDTTAAQELLDAADEFYDSLPTNLRQPSRGDARMQCGSAEREARQRIHQQRGG